MKRNPHLAELRSGYLFPEILRKKRIYLEANPRAPLLHLGIGDTTEPLPTCISEALSEAAKALGTEKGYSGYGPEEGFPDLRQKISEEYYDGKFTCEEIFISDGTNSDIGRLQILFGSEATLAVQNPSYPVYVDTGVILGQSGVHYKGISYLPCLPSNNFFPDLTNASKTDLIYFCSPNNPTGAAATQSQLEGLVAFAKRNQSIIVFDTAYARYIQDKNLPRSIYEISGGEEVGIELGSFSKMAGFTGVRLGWSVVPKTLRYEDGSSVNKDWNRVHCTFFNGASNIVQKGGLAVLSSEGKESIQFLIDHYMQNAKILRSAFEQMGFEVYGGINAPFLWTKLPFKTSWEAFDFLLEKGQILTAPGSGFGSAGEGFVRFSAFGKRKTIVEAVDRLKKLFANN